MSNRILVSAELEFDIRRITAESNKIRRVMEGAISKPIQKAESDVVSFFQTLNKSSSQIGNQLFNVGLTDLAAQLEDARKRLELFRLERNKLRRSGRGPENDDAFAAMTRNVKELEKVVGTAEKEIVQLFRTIEQQGGKVKDADLRQFERINDLTSGAQTRLKGTKSGEFKTRINDVQQYIRSLEGAQARLRALDQAARKKKDKTKITALKDEATETIVALKALEAAIVNAARTGGDFGDVDQEMVRLKQATEDATKQIHNQENAMGRNTLASINLLRVVQDAEYGMLGMANNIQEVVLSLSLASSMGTTFSKMLGGMIRELLIGKLALAFWPTVLLMVGRNLDKITLALQGARDQFRLWIGDIDTAEFEQNKLNRALEDFSNLNLDETLGDISEVLRDDYIANIKIATKEVYKLRDANLAAYRAQLGVGGALTSGAPTTGGVSFGPTLDFNSSATREERDRAFASRDQADEAFYSRFGVPFKQADRIITEADNAQRERLVDLNNQFATILLTAGSITEQQVLLNEAIEAGNKVGKDEEERIEVRNEYLNTTLQLQGRINDLAQQAADGAAAYLANTLRGHHQLANQSLIYRDLMQDMKELTEEELRVAQQSILNPDDDSKNKNRRNKILADYRDWLKELKKEFKDEMDLIELQSTLRENAINAGGKVARLYEDITVEISQNLRRASRFEAVNFVADLRDQSRLESLALERRVEDAQKAIDAIRQIRLRTEQELNRQREFIVDLQRRRAETSDKETLEEIAEDLLDAQRNYTNAEQEANILRDEQTQALLEAQVILDTQDRIRESIIQKRQNSVDKYIEDEARIIDEFLRAAQVNRAKLKSSGRPETLFSPIQLIKDQLEFDKDDVAVQIQEVRDILGTLNVLNQLPGTEGVFTQLIGGQNEKLDSLLLDRKTLVDIAAEKEAQAWRNYTRGIVDAASGSISELASAANELYSAWEDGRKLQLKEMGKTDEEITETLKREGAKRFEVRKKILYAEALSNAISAGVAVYSDTIKAIPGPVGIALGAVQYAAIVGTLVAKAKQIKNMRIGGGDPSTSAGGGGGTGGYEALNSSIVRERFVSFNSGSTNDTLAQIARNTQDTANKITDLKVTYDDKTGAQLTDRSAAYKNIVYR